MDNLYDVIVVGGGYAAAEESIFLTKFARHVTILVRKDDFSCAASVAEQAKNHEKITVLTNSIMEEVSGENGLNYIRYRNTVTGEVTEMKSSDGEIFGVFVLAGYTPETSLVKDILELNEQGYIVTDANQKTSVEGIYAAGDVCTKPLRQVVTATSDGALASTGLAFHGVPGGHEFTSFVLGLYNASGPGQAIDDEISRQITAIKDKVDIKVLVTLSCTMCPDLVIAAQRIAAQNPHISAHVYDIRHFEGLKERYNVMSVPCLVINDNEVYFGKKNIEQLIALIPKNMQIK